MSLQFEWVNDAEIQIAMSLRVSIFLANIIEILKHNCQVTHSNYTNQLMWLILYAKICEVDWKTILADSSIVCCFLFDNIPSICQLHDLYISGLEIYIHYTSTNVTCWWRLNIHKSVICHQILFACVRNLTQMSH